MNIRPGLLLTIVAIFAALFAGRYLGLFGGKNSPAPQVTQTEPDGSARPAPIEIDPPAPAPRPTPNPPAVRPKPGMVAVVPNPPPAPDNGGPITDWEQRIDDLLTNQDDETAKAKKMLAMFSRLPEDGKVEAAQHISNLLPDDQYSDLAKILLDTKQPEEVLEVLMTDLLNRPNGLKLNTLFDVARAPEHPKAEEARDVLEVFLDDVDWDALKASGNWDQVRQIKDKWIAENPDEEP